MWVVMPFFFILVRIVSLAVLNSLFSMEWRLTKDQMHSVVQILFIKNQLQEFVFSCSRYMDILLWNVVESIREPFQTNHARLCTHSKICTVVCHDMLNNQQNRSQKFRLRIYALKKTVRWNVEVHRSCWCTHCSRSHWKRGVNPEFECSCYIRLYHL